MVLLVQVPNATFPIIQISGLRPEGRFSLHFDNGSRTAQALDGHIVLSTALKEALLLDLLLPVTLTLEAQGRAAEREEIMGLLSLLARQCLSRWLFAERVRKLDAADDSPVGDVAAAWIVVVGVLAHAGRWMGIRMVLVIWQGKRVKLISLRKLGLVIQPARKVIIYPRLVEVMVRV